MNINTKTKKRSCEVEKLDWTSVYSYNRESIPHAVELTLPLESMQEICRKYDLSPGLGARGASYQAFHDWLVRHRRTRRLFYGHKTGFDIQSLVELFHNELIDMATLEKDKAND